MNMRLILLSFLVMFALIPGYSQKAKGDQFYEAKDYKNALAAYFKALRDSQTDPVLLFKIGVTYLNTEDKAQAVSFLEKAYKLDPEIDSEILFYRAVAYQSSLQYAKAKYMYEQFKKRTAKARWEEIDQRIAQCVVSHSILSNPIDVIIENVGSNVNSVFDDYSPVISPDGNTFYFTSDRTTDSMKIKLKTNFEDIYTSQWVDDDWSTPQKMGAPINMNHHDAIASISPDGKTLFIYYETNKGDLYTSVKDEKGQWAKPVPLKTINSPFTETSASVTADGKKLFFSSSRPGGKGGLDIYVSQLDATGNWGKPVSAGDLVNTAGDEDSPHIHQDGETLYFSSNGHPGMGSSDIFKSTLGKDGKWEKPQNMGYPINSIEYDGFFTISEDKKVAYFATMRKHGMGGYDVLKATYRSVFEILKPIASVAPVAATTTTTTTTTPAVVTPAPTTTTPTTTTAPVTTATASATKTEAVVKKEPEVKSTMFALKGKVLDNATSKPLGVTISLVNIKTNRMIASTQTDKVTGAYELVVKDGGDYVLTAESTGYLFNSVNVKVAPSADSKKIETNFMMIKPNAGSVMVLKNILFDPGKADLKSASLSELEKVRKLLLDNPNLRVRINGHTDNVGDAVINKSLSLKRSLAVVNYLALNGVEFERLGAHGYGSEHPVASNDEEKGGRELNRRIEIEILEILDKQL